MIRMNEFIGNVVWLSVSGLRDDLQMKGGGEERHYALNLKMFRFHFHLLLPSLCGINVLTLNGVFNNCHL
jgi:hypothetical protein